jgi:hypothetical protein
MFKKLWKKAKRAARTVFRVVKEVVQRVIGVIDFIGSLLGIRPKKFLRLKVFILKDQHGKQVVAQSQAEAWVARAKDIFNRRANIEIHAANQRAEQIVNVLDEKVPAEYLRPKIENTDIFTDEVDYFDDLRKYVITSVWHSIADLIGYGEPVFTFIVIDFPSSQLGVANTLWNFCLMSTKAGPTTLAHELGHMCGLLHRSDSGNLMKPGRDLTNDDNLTRWQISVIRNSRFVTYLRT